MKQDFAPGYLAVVFSVCLIFRRHMRVGAAIVIANGSRNYSVQEHLILVISIADDLVEGRLAVEQRKPRVDAVEVELQDVECEVERRELGVVKLHVWRWSQCRTFRWLRELMRRLRAVGGCVRVDRVGMLGWLIAVEIV